MSTHTFNRRVLDAPRDHLVHIIPNLVVSGCYSFATTLAQELKGQYAHTLLFERPIEIVDQRLIMYAYASGMSVLHADTITNQLLEGQGFTGCILYNVEGHPDLCADIPAIYYANGLYDAGTGADVVIASSSFSEKTSETGATLAMSAECIIPPFLQTRGLRRLKGPKHPFTVGIISSSDVRKYPSTLALHMLNNLPVNTGLILTTLPSYPNPAMTLTLDERKKRSKKSFVPVSVVPGMGFRYLLGADVCLFGPPSTYYEPYGKTIVEAMALGKVVICNRGCGPLTYLEHGINCLLYDTPDEALDHIIRIQNDEQTRKAIGVNAQMYASWHDSSVHLGKLKRVLRMIGT